LPLIVSVRLTIYLTPVNVPTSTEATTGTITIFFFNKSAKFIYHFQIFRFKFLNGLTTHFLNIALIIFFLLNFIEELVCIFCTPSSAIFYIPFRSLHFPIWNTIFYCKRRYIPYTSVVWLCCKIAIV
jgi:hypothetical protein